jgi:hypothetical protein
MVKGRTKDLCVSFALCSGISSEKTSLGFDKGWKVEMLSTLRQVRREVRGFKWNKCSQVQSQIKMLIGTHTYSLIGEQTILKLSVLKQPLFISISNSISISISISIYI